MNRRKILVGSAIAVPWAVVLCLAALYWWQQSKQIQAPAVPDGPVAAVPSASSSASGRVGKTGATQIYAHNLMLRKGPDFRVYVRWLRGELARTRRNEVPSFDDIDSFYLDIKTGVLRANIDDVGNFMNASGLKNSPLQHVKLRGDGDHVKLTGTVHKIFTLPVELDGTIGAMPDGRIRIHANSLKLLKIPLKGLLSAFRVTLADLAPKGKVEGLEMNGSDIFLDTQQLFPPPHIRGKLTEVHIVNPDLELVYGEAAKEVASVEQWRNYLHLTGGSLDFGKLTMNQVDLIMIDISKDAWFDLDLANYQQQLVHGYTRMTPQAGLQIFMPDVRDLPQDKPTRDISIQWLKNRNIAPPADIRTHPGGG